MIVIFALCLVRRRRVSEENRRFVTMTDPDMVQRTMDSNSMFYGTSAAPNAPFPPNPYGGGQDSWYTNDYPETVSRGAAPSFISETPSQSMGLRRKPAPSFVMEEDVVEEDEHQPVHQDVNSDPFWDPTQTFASSVHPPTPLREDAPLTPRIVDHPYSLPPARVSSPFEPFNARSPGAFLLMPDPPMSETQEHPDTLRPGRSPSPADPFQDSARRTPDLPQEREPSNRLSFSSDGAASDSIGVAM
jgi:hypothetical protein